MSEAACKAAICDDKAQSSSMDLAEIPNIIGKEDNKLRIEVAEFIIERNACTLEKVLKIIGDA